MTTQPCSKCGAVLRAYWLKDGVCNACRNPRSVIVAVVNGTTIKAVYDNGGVTICRYTIVFDECASTFRDDNFACLNIGDDPSVFSQFGECRIGRHLGRKITLEQLPIAIQNHIKSRLE